MMKRKNNKKIISIVLPAVAVLSMLGYFMMPGPEPEYVDIQSLVPDESCITDCTIPDEEIIAYAKTLNLLTNPVITDDLDFINTFILNQNAPSVDIIRVYDDGTNTSEKVVSDIDLFTNSFITVDDEFEDITDSTISYKVDIDSDSVKEGIAVFNIRINDDIRRTYTIDLTSDDEFLPTTLPSSVSSILANQRDGITKVTTELSELSFVTPGGNYKITEPVIINEISFEKQSVKILVSDEQGFPIKIYPIDDTLTISGAGSDYKYGYAECYSSTKGICNRWNVPLLSYSPAPEIGSVKIYDSSGNLYAESSVTSSGGRIIGIDWPKTYYVVASTTSISVDLQRNTEYRITVGSPQNADFIIKTPIEKTSYSYSCSVHGCNFPS